MSRSARAEKLLTKQIAVVHLSDIHFGQNHRFNPPRTPDGDVPHREGYPSLIEQLKIFLDQTDPDCPVIVCITGDFAQNGTPQEFAQSARFLEELSQASILGKVRGRESIFIVPGNHDVQYAEPNPAARLQQYAQLLSVHTRVVHDAADPHQWKMVHNRTSDLGAIIVTLNSVVWTQKDTPDQQRGAVDTRMLQALEEQLNSVPAEDLENSIKIALIHHHPVLIPALAEPGRGYDAVINGGKLLSILRGYGFQLILHGHKHDPYVFTEDSRAMSNKRVRTPILIAGSASIGSTELPDSRRNGFYLTTVKWHPASHQSRIKVDAISLRTNDEDGEELLPYRWTWRRERTEDFTFSPDKCVPSDASPEPPGPCAPPVDVRPTEYERLRAAICCALTCSRRFLHDKVIRQRCGLLAIIAPPLTFLNSSSGRLVQNSRSII